MVLRDTRTQGHQIDPIRLKILSAEAKKCDDLSPRGTQRNNYGSRCAIEKKGVILFSPPGIQRVHRCTSPTRRGVRRGTSSRAPTAPRKKAAEKQRKGSEKETRENERARPSGRPADERTKQAGLEKKNNKRKGGKRKSDVTTAVGMALRGAPTASLKSRPRRRSSGLYHPLRGFTQEAETQTRGRTRTQDEPRGAF